MTQTENSAVTTYTDLSSAELIEIAIQRGEGRLSDTGALVPLPASAQVAPPQTASLLKSQALRMILPGVPLTVLSLKTNSMRCGIVSKHTSPSATVLYLTCM